MPQPHKADRVHAWRARFGLAEEGLESQDLADAPRLEASRRLNGADLVVRDRILVAREEMKRIVQDQFGGDQALLDAIDGIILSSKDALAVLEQGQGAPELEAFDALEAIVAFDGTRPSFLIRDGEIDLESSFSTDVWKVTTLGPMLGQLESFCACVGRVESGVDGLGTAFLVTPTLAITNRHVAQLIADFADDGSARVRENVHLDFGREHQGRAEFDRRQVTAVVLAGAARIESPIDHGKLDLALIEVTASRVTNGIVDPNRYLKISGSKTPPAGLIGAVGYPGDWKTWVPPQLRSEYADVLARLLEGDAGSKRFAPGQPGPMRVPAVGQPAWTATHDATTINGNSGSPMFALADAGVGHVAGLHYGGRWGGERQNWAHLLSLCGDATCTPQNMPLLKLLREHGIPF